MSKVTVGKVIAVYLRVSTEEQAQSGLGLEAQLDRCTAYVRAVGLDAKGRVEVFRDAGVSAKTTDRPALIDMMRRVRARQVAAVVVLKVDRLARRTVDMLSMVDEFDRCGVSFASVSEQLDTATPTGRMVLTILAAVAQAEREAIAERTRIAVRTKIKRGFRHGYLPLGYTDNAGRLEPLDDEQATIRLILDFHDRGASLRTICAELKLLGRRTKRGGQWHPQNVANVIRRAGQVGDSVACESRQ